MPGTFAFTTRCDEVIVPSFNSTVEVVSIDSGSNPAAPRTKLSFIVKQPACEAASNSSGLVPTPSSNLDLYEYCALLSVELWVLRFPLPSLPDPFQTAVAVRFIAFFLVE